MTQLTSRKLRIRRPPAYLIGDNSDPQFFGYARTILTKDTISPAQQFNHLAKLFSKFVNSVNKRLIQKIKQSQQLQKISPQSPHQDQKNQKNMPEVSTKKSTQKKEQKDMQNKFNISSLINTKYVNQSNSNKDKGINTSKNLNKDKNWKSMEGGGGEGGNYNCKSLGGKQQGRIQSGSNSNPENPTQCDAAILAFQQQQQHNLSSNTHTRQKLQTQKPQKPKQIQNQNDKCFRRCAFHVAIAYQIHVNNLKQKGQNIQLSMYLDPTCPAKKLKDQYHYL